MTNRLRDLGIFFIVFFGVSVCFNWAGVREQMMSNPYAVDALVAATSAVLAMFLITAIRQGNRR
jgi:hypothetical protein